jgi:type IV pilus assembly protein PilO
MGSPKIEQGRIVSQTTFDLVAYAAPQEKPASGASSSANAPKVAQVGK